MNESMCKKQGCCFHPVQKNVGGSYIGYCYESEMSEEVNQKQQQVGWGFGKDRLLTRVIL